MESGMRALAKRKIVSVFAGAMLVGAAVNAQAQQWYVGAGAGKFDDEVVDDSDTGLKIFGGYTFNTHLALEAGYADFGSVGQSGVNFDQSTGYVAAVGLLPLSPQWTLFGKLGFNRWYVDGASSNDRGTDPMYGVGIQYNLTRQISLRAEFETFEDDIGDLLSVGASFSF
jgi:hypothetical protein